MAAPNQQNLPPKSPSAGAGLRSAKFVGYGEALQAGLTGSAATGGAGAAAAAACVKNVEVVEKDGVVEKIIVRCSCGEVTEVLCQYSE